MEAMHLSGYTAKIIGIVMVPLRVWIVLVVRILALVVLYILIVSVKLMSKLSSF